MNLFLFSVESYLQDIHVQSLNNSVGVNAIPTGAHIRDDEQVCLTLLLFYPPPPPPPPPHTHTHTLIFRFSKLNSSFREIIILASLINI